MEVVCTNIDNNQLLGSGTRSSRDRGGEPANHSEAAAFGPSPGKLKPQKFTNTDVDVTVRPLLEILAGVSSGIIGSLSDRIFTDVIIMQFEDGGLIFKELNGCFLLILV
ncbi:hypothetical protein E2C01_037489 [Portunus trituberculatus]|uniref:Uncharacterized protein n=1 Tax=Portunus trituberculatus TaxID=210409 RepID=A0A5B7FH81_PORTR|nr:hypothetical protein [Portunus trituberculatus]